MNIRTSVTILLLWSSYALCKPNTESSVPVSTPAFTIYPNLTYIPDNSFYKVDNMPAIQSQDTVGSCFGCAASTIVQKYICDNDSDIKKLGIACDDPKFPKTKMVSQLSMIAWADTNKNRTATNSENQEAGNASNHTNLKLYTDRTIYSSGSNALQNAVETFEFMPESCFPFDQLVNIYGIKGKYDSKTKKSILFEKIYEKTRNFYDRYRKKKIEANALCTSCLKDLNEDFGTSFDKNIVANALDTETYGEFLYSLLVGNCKSVTFSNTAKFRQLPSGTNTFPRADLYKNIKSILDKKKPVQINSVCVSAKKEIITVNKENLEKKVCESYHTTVISGYRTACPSISANPATCRKQLLVHNCWGQEWQANSNGGWVDADSLMDSIAYEDENIKAGELSWLE